MVGKDTRNRLGKKMEIEVFKPYLTSMDRGFHLRNLARALEVDHSTLKPYLGSLKSRGVMREEKEGRNSVFYLQEESCVLPYYLVQAESDRTIQALQNKDVLSFLQGVESKLTVDERSGIDALVLFGSTARKEDNEDIDVLVSCSSGLEEVSLKLRELESLVGKPVDVQRTDLDRLSSKGSGFGEIVRSHIVLFGVEEFIQTFLGFKYG